MKILFIKPRASTINLTIDLPLGVLYLSAYLKQHLGLRVRIRLVDVRVEPDGLQALSQVLETFQPDLVGITLMTFEEHILSGYTDMIRRHAPSARIVTGGPFATYNYESILADGRIDWAVIGEGEQVLLNLVRCLMDGVDPRSLNGIAFRTDGKVVCNPREPYIENLDDLPLPDYELLDMSRYWGRKIQMNMVLAEKRYAPVMSSRACPYRCKYCHNIFGKKVRKRSPEHFVNEIWHLYETYGVREFHIVDDIFNIDRKRMHAILNMIIDSPMRLKIAFPNAIRGDLLSEEDIRLLKRAGAYMITVAIETASPRMQKIIDKNLDIERVMRNIEFANRIGLLTRAYFMLGFPGETVPEIYQSIRLAVESRLDMVAFFLVVPFKNTPLYGMALDAYPHLEGPRTEWNYYSEEPFYKAATGFDLSRLQKLAYIRFYILHPRRLLRLFIKVPMKAYFIERFLIDGLSILRKKRLEMN